MGELVRAIATQDAPPPRGTYAQATRAGGLLFCATQLPVDPASGDLVEGARAQTNQALANLEAVCRAGGTSLRHALLLRVYFVERADWPEVEAAFAAWFTDARPARVPVHVVSLAPDARVSVEATVACPDG